MIALLMDPANYSFSLYAVPPYVATVAVLLLGCMVLIRERILAVSFSFFLLALAVSAWLFTIARVYSTHDAAVALWWSKATYLGAPFIAPSAYLFTVVVLRQFQKYKYAVCALWLIAPIFAALTFSGDAMIKGLKMYPWGYYGQFNWGGTALILFDTVVLGGSMLHYLSAFRNGSPGTTQHTRVKWLMGAFAIGYLGTVDFLPAYGIEIYPFGYLAIFGFMVVAALTVWRYHFVDITPALAAREVMDTMMDALIVLDRDGVVQLANRSALELFGSEIGLVGKPIRDTRGGLLFSDRFLSLVRRQPVRNYESVFKDSSGTVRTLSLSASTMNDRQWAGAGAGGESSQDHQKFVNGYRSKEEQSQPVATVCLARDITVHKASNNALERNVSFVQLLQVVATAANTASTIEEAMQLTLQRVCALTGWAIGHVFLTSDSEPGALISTGVWSVSDPEQYRSFTEGTGELVFNAETGVPGYVLSTGKPAIVVDMMSGFQSPRAHLAKAAGLKAAFAFPVLVGEEVVGVLEFFSDNVAKPESDLLEVMSHIGKQLGRVVERKRAEASLRASEMKFRSVTQSASDAIVSSDSAGNIISWNMGAQRIFGYCEGEVLGESISILMPPSYRESYTSGMERVKNGGERRAVGRTLEMRGLRKDGTDFPLELSISTWTTAEGTFFSGIMRDVTERKRIEAELNLLNKELESRVEERTVQLSAANQELEMEIAERKRAEAALRELAITDDLTGLYNRREMNRLLADEVGRCRRYGRPLSFLMLDIDHFKQVNDSHGHHIGDAVLYWLGELLTQNLRTTDKVARYGGEEFALILPETVAEDAMLVAEDICRVIESTPFTYREGDEGPFRIGVTASLGLATLTPEILTEAALLLAADRALYDAKERGRNCVVRFTGTLTSGKLTTGFLEDSMRRASYVDGSVRS